MTFREGSQKLARALLLPINPAVVVLLGFYTVLWGFWVANPWWTVFTQAPLYSEMAAIAPFAIPPEIFWGCLAMFAGAVIIYGAVNRSYRSLSIGSSVVWWHWCMISILYFLGDFASTGGITAAMMATYGAFLWVNLRVNYKPHESMDDVFPSE